MPKTVLAIDDIEAFWDAIAKEQAGHFDVAKGVCFCGDQVELWSYSEHVTDKMKIATQELWKVILDAAE